MMCGMVAVLMTFLVPPMWMLTPPVVRVLVLTLQHDEGDIVSIGFGRFQK